MQSYINTNEPSSDEHGSLSSGCLALDLEVGKNDGIIHAFGAVRTDTGGRQVHSGGGLGAALERLDDCADGASFILGHNLIAFDLPHLRAKKPDLRLLELPAVDTLRLSPLAFPRNPYHHLVKHYQDGALRRRQLNDPELDARLALEVFGDQRRALQEAEPDLLTAWHWLVTPMPDGEDRAVDAFFSELRGARRPSDAVREMMKAAQYGHIIKHLETHHMDPLPVVQVNDKTRVEFGLAAREVLDKRDRAYALTLEAEQQFTDAFGDIEIEDLGETGFTVRANQQFASPRRRLDAWHHNPSGKSIAEHLSRHAIGWNSIIDLGFEVWLPTRFRRIAADDGVFLLDSSDLFEINPDITKRIADKDFGDPHDGRVKHGWILLSRSGQIYGLNGSAMIAGHCHEGKVISDYIIRIAPKQPKCRAGYLLMAMTHPKLGRPRIKALPYGSSIPEIEVYDAQRFQIPLLDTRLEAEIADRVEEVARLRDEADRLENQLADRAEAAIADFLSHKSSVT